MTTYVAVSQAPSTGAVTATLYLDKTYVNNHAGQVISLSMDFLSSSNLCKATTTIGAASIPCPSAMNWIFNAYCFPVSCTADGNVIKSSKNYNVVASFSICPASNPKCWFFDSITSSSTRLAVVSPPPAPAPQPETPAKPVSPGSGGSSSSNTGSGGGSGGGSGSGGNSNNNGGGNPNPVTPPPNSSNNGGSGSSSGSGNGDNSGSNSGGGNGGSNAGSGGSSNSGASSSNGNGGSNAGGSSGSGSSASNGSSGSSSSTSADTSNGASSNNGQQQNSGSVLESINAAVHEPNSSTGSSSSSGTSSNSPLSVTNNNQIGSAGSSSSSSNTNNNSNAPKSPQPPSPNTPGVSTTPSTDSQPSILPIAIGVLVGCVVTIGAVIAARRYKADKEGADTTAAAPAVEPTTERSYSTYLDEYYTGPVPTPNGGERLSSPIPVAARSLDGFFEGAGKK
ncbi:hypothetical protein HDU79_009598 [Rhizoclosmatium sp. JEL0117]|nr:hypothetical protein HDU79_009598 [Rhizoclosmatium sp. JEL0117]